MKKSLRFLLLATTLVLPAIVHAEDMKMCERGTSCPMKEQMGGMQKQMEGMMEHMKEMMNTPCDKASKKDMNSMMQQMQEMHEHMGQMMGMMGGKDMMDKEMQAPSDSEKGASETPDADHEKHPLQQ